MPFLLTLARWFDLAIRFLAGAAIAALTLAVLLGVISRTLNDPYAWTDEASRILMIWVAAFGWVMATRSHAHIRIRFFHDLLPSLAWGIVEIVINAAIVLFGLLLAVYGVDLVSRNIDVEATSLPLSMAWLYMPLLVGGAATFIQAAADCVTVALRLRSGQHPRGEAVT